MKFRLISKTFLLSAAVAAVRMQRFPRHQSRPERNGGVDRDDTRYVVEIRQCFLHPDCFRLYYARLQSLRSGDRRGTANQSAVQCSYFNKGVINANLNPISNLYTDCYEGIRAANFFLDYTANGKGEYMVGMNRDTINDRPTMNGTWPRCTGTRPKRTSHGLITMPN